MTRIANRPLRVQPNKHEGTFLSYPLWPLEALPNWEFDAVLIADMEQTDKIHGTLIGQGIARDKIVRLSPMGASL